MNIEELDNKIIIIKDSYKKILLKKINDSKKLINVKIITLSELLKKYYFDYDKECIYYVCNKYNVVYDVAKIYIDSLYYVNKDLCNEKVKFLNDLKIDLINNNMIKINSLFRKFLMNKDIILYDLEYIDKLYINIIEDIKVNNNVKVINTKYEFSKKILFEAVNQEEEIVFVASKICELINSGIDINNIKLSNVSENYYFIIKKIFSLFNIPVNLKSKYPINGTFIVSKFKELYSNDMESVFNELNNYVKTLSDKDIYKSLINIVNEYNFISDFYSVRDLIYHDIDNSYVKVKKLKNAVNIIDLDNILYVDDYVFLINFNEGIIPVNYKDEDYLNDKIKTELCSCTSYELNTINNLNIKNIIKYSKNLILSYTKNMNNEEVYVSSSYSSDILDIEKINIKYNYSNAYNKLKLLSLKDENRKFGSVSNDLLLLNTKYKDEKYLNYDNSYKLIDKDKLNEYLSNKLSLSYTSMNEFYKCKFRYYLSYILKVNKYQESYEAIIGRIFHKILSECFNDEYDLDLEYEKEINSYDYEFTNSERFFLHNLKDELKLIVDTIKEQLKYTRLSNTMYEKEVIVKVNDKLNITFKGIIDKLMYENVNDKTIVAIVDYKTGNTEMNLKYAKFGLNLQLPVYIYLTQNMSEIDNVVIGGFYLQKILKNTTDIDEKIKELKLQGYSNNDLDVLCFVDSNYENSKVIKSLKVNADGSFYRYSKLLSNSEIDELSKLVHEKIVSSSNDIINSSFEINPKQIKNDLIGCKFCDYRDICYMKNSDIVKLNIDEEGNDE